MQNEQKFQSKAQLFALQVHGVWTKFEDVVLFPFRWVSAQVSQTHVFQQEPARVVVPIRGRR